MMPTQRTERAPLWPYLARSQRHNLYDLNQKAARQGAFQRARFRVPGGAHTEDGADLFSAMSAACRSGNHVMLKNLLDLGTISPNATRPGSFTLMREAILEGHTACVEVLLAYGADVNLRESEYGFRCTPLMDAISFNHEDIVALLLQRGANPNLADSKGRTALHYAVGQPTYVMWLLKCGADVHARDELGRTALMDACIRNTTTRDIKCRMLLMTAGSPKNAVDQFNMTAWDILEKRGKVPRVQY